MERWEREKREMREIKTFPKDLKIYAIKCKNIVMCRNLFPLSSVSKLNWLHRDRLLARSKP